MSEPDGCTEENASPVPDPPPPDREETEAEAEVEAEVEAPPFEGDETEGNAPTPTPPVVDELSREHELQLLAEMGEQVKGVGTLREKLEPRKVSMTLPEGDDFTPQTDSFGRRRSLATAAYEQAQSNAGFLRTLGEGMEDISRDNDELASFLKRRQSWKEHCGHNIASFARSINDARTTKKAAHQFLNLIGKGLSKSEASRGSHCMSLFV